jgi:hypothetical protein
MENTDHELPAGGFNIQVNPEVAFSMIYEDAIGQLLFAVEVDDEPKKIYLNCLPSEAGRIADVNSPSTRTRVDLAIKRLIAHFRNQGLSVELD